MSDLLNIALGTEDFKEIIQNNSYYIDKTSFIKQISYENVALFTRPRRFGKTLTMSMIQNFFEMNYENPSDISKTQELFKNLAISTDSEFCQKHMGQYPVIFLSLKEVKGDDFAEAISKFASEIRDEWTRFSSVIKNNISVISDELKVDIDDCKKDCYTISRCEFKTTPKKDSSKIKKSLKLLAKVLSIIFNKKAIVIVDEYDVPLEKSRGKYYRAMVDFIGGLFSETFKTNSFLAKGFLTGCLRISRESIFTGFNNLQVYDCATTKYAELFGFTNDEVKQLLKDYNVSDKFDIFKEWYDGYQIGNSEIYNPYSVLSYVSALTDDSTAEPVNAWINASSNDFLSEFIRYLPDNELNDFEILLQGGVVKKDLNETLNYGDFDNSNTNSKDENEDNEDSKNYTNMWTMLYVTGYLTKVGKKAGTTFTLRIPNKEVRNCFEQKIVKYFKCSPEYRNYARDLIYAFVTQNTLGVKKLLNKLLPKYLGLRNVKANLEYTYHSFIDGLLASSGIDLDSEQEAGNGYSDIAFTTKDAKTKEDIAVILELKRTNDSKTMREKCREAIKQCHDKFYYKDYQEEPSIKHIYIYGITFCNRACAVMLEEVAK